MRWPRGRCAAQAHRSRSRSVELRDRRCRGRQAGGYRLDLLGPARGARRGLREPSAPFSRRSRQRAAQDRAARIAGTPRAVSLRLFFALWPPAPARERLAAAGRSLALADGCLRVPQGAFTSRLLSSARYPPSRSSAYAASAPAPAVREPLSLHFDAYEYWPKPEVVVAVARDPVPLQCCGTPCTARSPPTASSCAWKTATARDARAPVRPPPRLPLLAPFVDRARVVLVNTDPGATPPVYTVVDTWPLLDKRRRLRKTLRFRCI